MTSILQDWVSDIGLRHQGALISIIRGCDSVGKEDVSKHLIRQIRGTFLVCHCGDPLKAKTFIEAFDKQHCSRLMETFSKNTDHYPLHFVMHLLHSCEIIGYKHPDDEIRNLYNDFYHTLCNKFHLNGESETQLDERLDADEETFVKTANCSTIVCMETQKYNV